MEVSLRLCDDAERDYCFQISKNDTINTRIHKIFNTKPDYITVKDKKEKLKLTLSDIMVLRPTVFHNYKPTKYYKSVHPGVLTEGGCLVNSYDANQKEYLVELDNDKPLFEQLWPGQLIIPKWDYNRNAVLTIAILLSIWLYTDLPDCISPTPGICLTNQLSKLVIPLLDRFSNNPMFAERLREEISVNYSSVMAQWCFFVCHVVKISVVVFFCKFGLVNPLSFNPIKFYKLRKYDITKRSDDMKLMLKNIGWIGSKKASTDDYQQNYYSYMTTKYGGTVPLFKSGLLKIAANPGIPLNNGEGYQTPLDERFTGSTFTEINTTGKFVLSEEYFIELENILKEQLNETNGDIGLMNQQVKRFRKYGLYEPNDRLKDLVAKRREVFNEQNKTLDEKKKQ